MPSSLRIYSGPRLPLARTRRSQMTSSSQSAALYLITLSLILTRQTKIGSLSISSPSTAIRPNLHWAVTPVWRPTPVPISDLSQRKWSCIITARNLATFRPMAIQAPSFSREMATGWPSYTQECLEACTTTLPLVRPSGGSSSRSSSSIPLPSFVALPMILTERKNIQGYLREVKHIEVWCLTSSTIAHLTNVLLDVDIHSNGFTR
jgi:hypothetical protein